MARKLLKKNTKIQKVIKKVKETPKMTSHQATGVDMPVIAMPTGEYVEAVGRRKVATARVRVYKQPGDFVVNGKAAGQYFANIANSHVLYNKPFEVTDNKNAFAVSAVISGSGIKAQLEALVHAIARALDKMDETKHHALLKEAGMLTRDDRMKETRKIGMGGKARRKRQSPKR